MAHDAGEMSLAGLRADLDQRMRGEVADELADAAISGFQRIKIEELAANVKCHALHRKSGQIGQPVKDAGRQINSDAELIFLFTSRNLGMGARIHIWIDAQRYGSGVGTWFRGSTAVAPMR